jgi:hypothetical protein
VANQLASYVTASLQRGWRQVRGADASEMTLIARVHGRHLKQALRLRR